MNNGRIGVKKTKKITRAGDPERKCYPWVTCTDGGRIGIVAGQDMITAANPEVESNRQWGGEKVGSPAWALAMAWKHKYPDAYKTLCSLGKKPRGDKEVVHIMYCRIFKTATYGFNGKVGHAEPYSHWGARGFGEVTEEERQEAKTLQALAESYWRNPTLATPARTPTH